MSQLVLAALSGAGVLFGVWAIAAGTAMPAVPRLDDALEVMDGRPAPPATEGSGHLGGWLRAHWRRPVSESLSRRLRLTDRSIDQHFSIKAISAAVGALLPLVVAGLASWLVSAEWGIIAVAAVPLVIAGFFLPDALLAAREPVDVEDATEALLSYFDLVTLERLANRSGSQALRSAAAVSDLTVFVAIRETLERARLEQRAPYEDLKRLAADLGLPALADVAEVMSLDEAGASLAPALQARVRELRDAHLTNAKVTASAISERMTFFMVVPALVFAGFFLVPPILRLLAE